MEKCVNGFFTHFDSSKVPALQWGTSNEPKAFQRYLQGLPKGARAWECGFYINKKYPWLGGSPDGFMQDPKATLRTIEIKCPYNGRDMCIDEMFAIRGDRSEFFLEETDSLKFQLKKSHGYYCQIQGVMELAGTNKCDFIVYTTKDFFVTTVHRDQSFIDDMMKKLKMFYFRFLLPNLCRRARYDSQMPPYREISQEIYEKKYK